MIISGNLSNFDYLKLLVQNLEPPPHLFKALKKKHDIASSREKAPDQALDGNGCGFLNGSLRSDALQANGTEGKRWRMNEGENSLFFANITQA